MAPVRKSNALSLFANVNSSNYNKTKTMRPPLKPSAIVEEENTV